MNTLVDFATSLQPTTGQEVGRLTQNPGDVLGKPVYAELNIDFEPIDPYTKDDVFEELVTLFDSASWVREDEGALPGFYSGSIQSGSATILVSVVVRSQTDQVRVTYVYRN